MNTATLTWLALAAVCGTLLFYTSQQATSGRAELARLERALLREEESLRVLTAEWSYLNQPERLEKLARAHLDLVPLQGRQFTRMDDIPVRGAQPPATIEPAAGKPAIENAKPAIKNITPAVKNTETTKSVIKAQPVSTTPSRGFTDVLKTLEGE